MSVEEFEEAQRVFEVARQAADDELWRMCCLMASKQNSELLGETEFQLRDMLLRVGAKALEAGVNERRKKGGTRAAALSAQGRKTASRAIIMPGSSAGARRRS
jgi:hypothetical protein